MMTYSYKLPLVLSIEFEVATCVVVGNIFDHTCQRLHIVGQQAFLHIIAEEVTEQSAEILMARIAEEGAGVGEHSHEAAEQSEHGKRVHLPCHAIELVVEPPSRTKLNLSRARTILEIAKHGSDDLVGAGVERIDNGTR